MSRGDCKTFAWNCSSWSVLDVNPGSVYAAKIANYSLQLHDKFIEATANTFTITLYGSSGSFRDQEHEFFNSGTGTVTLQCTGSDKIGFGGAGVSSVTLTQNQYYKLRQNGSGWMITGRN